MEKRPSNTIEITTNVWVNNKNINLALAIELMVRFWSNKVVLEIGPLIIKFRHLKV